MGIIMAVVAVLEIHMDSTAVGSMKPSSTRRGEVPTSSSARRPTRLQFIFLTLILSVSHTSALLYFKIKIL